MVCCCSLAGTRACLTCANNPYSYSEYFYNNYIPVVSRTYTVSTDTSEEFLKIISNLNQHIETLRDEIKELKNERESQTIGKDIRTETCAASSAEGVCYKTEEDNKTSNSL